MTRASCNQEPCLDAKAIPVSFGGWKHPRGSGKASSYTQTAVQDAPHNTLEIHETQRKTPPHISSESVRKKKTTTGWPWEPHLPSCSRQYRAHAAHIPIIPEIRFRLPVAALSHHINLQTTGSRHILTSSWNGNALSQNHPELSSLGMALVMTKLLKASGTWLCPFH